MEKIREKGRIYKGNKRGMRIEKGIRKNREKKREKTGEKGGKVVKKEGKKRTHTIGQRRAYIPEKRCIWEGLRGWK